MYCSGARKWKHRSCDLGHDPAAQFGHRTSLRPGRICASSPGLQTRDCEAGQCTGGHSWETNNGSTVPICLLSMLGLRGADAARSTRTCTPPLVAFDGSQKFFHSMCEVDPYAAVTCVHYHPAFYRIHVHMQVCSLPDFVSQVVGLESVNQRN